MVHVKTYTHSMLNSILKYCEEEYHRDNSPAAVNIWSQNWEQDSYTLPYILEKTSRFNPNGSFFILYEDSNIIGCSGIYISEFSDKVAIAGTRTWISKEYRNKKYIRDYLLPQQKLWALDNKIEIIALTFNEYNKGIVKMFRNGQRHIENYTPLHIFYSNFHSLGFMVDIQHTPQWVIYEKLGEYNFDWESLKI